MGPIERAMWQFHGRERSKGSPKCDAYPGLHTPNSLNRLFVKVDLLRRREEESSPVGRNKEDSSLTTITHRYEKGNGRETGLQGKTYLQGKAKFQLVHEGGDVQGRR